MTDDVKVLLHDLQAAVGLQGILNGLLYGHFPRDRFPRLGPERRPFPEKKPLPATTRAPSPKQDNSILKCEDFIPYSPFHYDGFALQLPTCLSKFFLLIRVTE